MKIDNFKSAISARSGLARTNLFKVFLPSAASLGLTDAQAEGSTTTLDLMCNATQLPGRQIATNERMIGMKSEKMPYGYLTDDVTLSFYDNNKYSIRRYFSGWQESMVSSDRREIKYKNEYAKLVGIHQLNKQGELVYKVTLLEAFPTTVNVIDLNNDQDGLVQCNVTLSFTDWR